MKKPLEKLENNSERFRRTKKRIEKFRPIDDMFFEKVAEDLEVCEELLRVILKEPGLKVLEVIPQKSVKNLQGRSVRLDALCIRENGHSCNIEIHRARDENPLKHVRYNASCITANIMDPGEKFENVPEVSVIYISEFDVFKLKRTIYHVEPAITETNDKVDNGLHEVYVNTAVDDGSEISELMQCFLQTDVNNEKFPKFSKRVYFFKHSEEGIKDMSSVSEELKRDGMEEARQDDILELLEDLGEIPEMLEAKILRQTDLDILKKWLKFAAKALSIEEFENQIGTMQVN